MITIERSAPGRNVAFKAAKMSEALQEAQSFSISHNVVDIETPSDYKL